MYINLNTHNKMASFHTIRCFYLSRNEQKIASYFMRIIMSEAITSQLFKSITTHLVIIVVKQTMLAQIMLLVITMIITSSCVIKDGQLEKLQDTKLQDTVEPQTNTNSQDSKPLFANTSKFEANKLESNANIDRVVDGDTIIVKIGKHSESVRLIGIDTPESVARTRPVQCYGKEASLYMTEILPPGTDVTLIRDVEARDAYDRLLAYVVRSVDGLFVNFEMVNAGYANVLNYPPNDHYADEFQRAESAAIASKRGLWGACDGPDEPLN